MYEIRENIKLNKGKNLINIEGRMEKKSLTLFLFVVGIVFMIGSVNAVPNVEDEWIYSSETSAVIYWQTNESAYSYVEYGTNPATHENYASQTSQQGDNWLYSAYGIFHEGYYSHFHRLTGLERNRQYYYRIVSIDPTTMQEIVSSEKTFTTNDYSGEIDISTLSSCAGDAGAGGTDPNTYQYCISSSGTYVMKSDLTANEGGIRVLSSASNVVIDLDGHTLTYNNVVDGTRRQRHGIIVEGDGGTNMRVLNGIIKQGAGNDGATRDNIGHNPIVFYNSNVVNSEVAGITADWAGNLASGILFYTSSEDNRHAHHNFVNDRGTDMYLVYPPDIPDRDQLLEGLGGPSGAQNNLTYDHNILNRTRHAGITWDGGPGEVYKNEIYGDSWATNAELISIGSDSDGYDVYKNKVFGTGYISEGMYLHATASNILLHDNFVKMHGDLNIGAGRWPEYGAGCCGSANGLRIFWGAPYNASVYNNYINVTGINGARARGIMIDHRDVPMGLDVFNNTVISHGDSTSDVSSMRHLRATSGSVSLTVRNNLIISDTLNIAFGDSTGSLYQGAFNAILFNNTVRKIGNQAHYHTVKVGDTSAYSTNGNILRDNKVEGGADLTDCDFVGYGDNDYAVEWTLTVNVEDLIGNPVPAGSIIVENGDSTLVYNSFTDESSIPVIVRSFYGSGTSPANYQEEYYNPFTVTVAPFGNVLSDTLTVDTTSSLTLTLPFVVPVPSLTECEINSAGNWQSCDNLDYGETLLRVRTTCTPGDGNLIGANFSFVNVEDSNTFFTGQVSGAGPTYTLDNNNILIQDSGNFEFSARCDDDIGRYGLVTERWDIPWGTLSVASYPTPISVDNGNSFVYSTNLLCTGGECGNIHAYLDPETVLTYNSGLLEDGYSRLDGLGGGNYGIQGYMVTGLFNSDRYYWSWIEFNVSSIPRDATINSVNLELYHYGDAASSHVGETYDVYGSITPDWFPDKDNTNTGCYDHVNYPANCPVIDAPLLLGASPQGGVGGEYWQTFSLDVGWFDTSLKAGWENITFMVNRTADGTNDDLCYFRTGDYPNSDYAPRLVVNWVPKGYKGGVIPVGSGDPFYIQTGGQNPIICSDMQDGDTCSTSWNVAANGENNTYTFWVIYNATYDGVIDIDSPETNVTIGELVFSQYDVNADGNINIMDLALEVYWNGKNSGNEINWDWYSHLDLNDDNGVNWLDVVEIILRI